MNFNTPNIEAMPSDFQNIAFAEIAWAFSLNAMQSIEEALKLHSQKMVSYNNICSNLHYYLILRLSKLITPCFTSEMALQNSIGKLQALDGRKRYLEFVKLVFEGNFLKTFFNHYPVLLQSLEKTLHYWKQCVLELFDRLSLDFEEIRKIFSQSDEVQLQHLNMDLSDEHNEGRTVFKLTFNDFILIYKPKDLRVEKYFNDFLHEINQLDFKPDLKAITVLAKENYGWVEFVEHYACSDHEEVKKFYIRSGVCLFLWYLLEGTDAHFENLICHGQYPVMIDVETLFHPDFHEEAEINPFKNSILRTGLLPFVGSLNALNYGGLTANADEMVPEFHVQFANINTDSMQLIRKTSFVNGNKHLVYLNDAPMSFIHHIDDICEGFRNSYDFFCLHKKYFTNSPSLMNLMQAKTRIVMRATATYDHLQKYLNFPTHLTSFDHREQFLQSALSGYPSEILENEKKQLLNLDIPYFYSFPNSKNLYSADETCFENFFQYPTASLVASKIEKLNLNEMKKQLKLLKTSLSCFLANKSRNEQTLFKKSSLEVAECIAEKIHNSIAFLTDDSIYNGQCGVALFFAALSKVTKDNKWSDQAKEMMEQSLAKFQDIQMHDLCAFSGFGSLMYASLKTGQLLGDQNLIKQSIHLVEQFQELHLENCQRLDFVGGISGFITVLTSCYKTTKDRRFLDLAIKSGNQFMAKFAQEKQHEIGLSHGLAGYAHGMFQLASITKNSKFQNKYLEEAKKIVHMEQELYLSSDHVKFNSWCHGYTGIALSRLDNISYYDNETIRQELSIALNKTKDSIGCESSLCCGDFGRFAFLMEYARRTAHQANYEESSARLEKEVRQLAYLFINEYLRTEGNNPSLKDQYRFGFMQGIAGIGYGLLKLTHPTKLPQVLLLQ